MFYCDVFIPHLTLQKACKTKKITKNNVFFRKNLWNKKLALYLQPISAVWVLSGLRKLNGLIF